MATIVPPLTPSAVYCHPVLVLVTVTGVEPVTWKTVMVGVAVVLVSAGQGGIHHR